jgi:hypothetical protein
MKTRKQNPKYRRWPRYRQMWLRWPTFRGRSNVLCKLNWLELPDSEIDRSIRAADCRLSEVENLRCHALGIIPVHRIGYVRRLLAPLPAELVTPPALVFPSDVPSFSDLPHRMFDGFMLFKEIGGQRLPSPLTMAWSFDAFKLPNGG